MNSNIGKKSAIHPEPFAFKQTLLRNLSWSTGLFPPYPGIPHLRGHWKHGRLLNLINSPNGILDNLLAAAAEIAKSASSSPQMCSFWIEQNLFLLLTNPEDIHDFKIRCNEFLERPIPFFDNEFPGLPSLVNSHGKPGLKLRKAYKTFLYDSQALTQLTSPTIEFIHVFLERTIEKEVGKVWDSNYLFSDFILKLSMHLFMGMDKNTACAVDNQS